MRNFVITIFLGFTMFSCSKNSITYPITEQVDTTDNYFGTKVPDPYRWLEDDNSEETKAWVVAQNEVTSNYLKSIPFREKIKTRLTKIWNFERQVNLAKKSGIYYYEKNNGLQNQNVYYYQKSLTGEPKILIDPNTLSTDGTVALNGIALSGDGKFLAYQVSKSGSDWVDIYFKEIETGKVLDDHLKWVKFSNIAWKADGVYYSRYDEPKQDKGLTDKNQFQKVYFHKLGTPQEDDILIIKEDNVPDQMFTADVTEDNKYLIIYESRWGFDGNDILIKEIEKPNSKFIRIGKSYNFEYSIIGNKGDVFYVQTNDGAPKKRLFSVDVKNVDEKYWNNILPEKETVLDGVILSGEKSIVAHYLKDAHSKLEIYETNGTYVKDLELPSLGTVLSISSKANDAEIFYTFTSFTYPTASYIYNISNSESKPFFSPKLDFIPNDYETNQVFYTSKDGTKVPMYIVHKKGIELNGQNPLLLYAYGGFNISLTPSFSIPRIAWLENGGIYVMANLRGGGEYGKEWHEGGTKLKKQNVFDDFIAAAEYLIQKKYTSPQKLAIMGGSNGGLLIGAVTNQRPDLFSAAIPMVGVMDMLRFHKFTIGGSWVSDYGSSDDSTQFDYLFKYSPIHNISKTAKYPSVLVTTADHDDRVVPAHSFKYIATLQEKYKGENPVLIRIQTKAGHGAGKPTAILIDEQTDIYSFIFKNLGVNPIY